MMMSSVMMIIVDFFFGFIEKSKGFEEVFDALIFTSFAKIQDILELYKKLEKW